MALPARPASLVPKAPGQDTSGAGARLGRSAPRLQVAPSPPEKPSSPPPAALWPTRRALSLTQQRRQSQRQGQRLHPADPPRRRLARRARPRSSPQKQRQQVQRPSLPGRAPASEGEEPGQGGRGRQVGRGGGGALGKGERPIRCKGAVRAGGGRSERTDPGGEGAARGKSPTRGQVGAGPQSLPGRKKAGSGACDKPDRPRVCRAAPEARSTEPARGRALLP